MHNNLNSSSSFPQMHTNTSSQKNQHGNILAKKKNLFLRCTQTHPHRKTNTEIYLLKKKKKNPNGKTKKRQIGAYRNDRSSWVSLGRSSWVPLGRSSWVWVLIGARSYGSVQLWIDACDRNCGSVIGVVIGAVMMWIGL